jgi:steroid delta-isomerase-like uncharacterized protein
MESENRMDFTATLATFRHPHYEIIPTGDVYDGVDQVNGYYTASRTTFPDQRNEVHAVHHADDGVIVEFDLLGTFLGSLRGLPPTGREFRTRMIALFLFETDDDLISCERVYFDSAGLLRQLAAE